MNEIYDPNEGVKNADSVCLEFFLATWYELSCLQTKFLMNKCFCLSRVVRLLEVSENYSCPYFLVVCTLCLYQLRVIGKLEEPLFKDVRNLAASAVLRSLLKTFLRLEESSCIS